MEKWEHIIENCRQLNIHCNTTLLDRVQVKKDLVREKKLLKAIEEEVETFEERYHIPKKKHRK